MTSMTSPTTRVVIGGVDTHGQTHHAAVIDGVGRQLGDREFTATPAGYRALAAWPGKHGTLQMIGVEGTGAARRLMVNDTGRRLSRMGSESLMVEYPCSTAALFGSQTRAEPGRTDGYAATIVR